MSPFAHCDVCARSMHIPSTVPAYSVPPTGNVAENSAYVMLSRVTSLQGLAFIAPPALSLLRRALDPDYVRFNKNNFSFTDYIALRAAYLHQEPESIYIHTNLAGPEYFTGKYWQLIQEEYALRSRIRIVECQLPRQVFGQNLSSDWHVKHGSDLTRIRIMIKYGGIYLDNKVFLIQRLDKYRKFEISMQWNDGQFLENQVNIKNLTNIMFQF